MAGNIKRFCITYTNKTHTNSNLVSINLFHATISFYTPLKKSEIYLFSDLFGDIERDQWHEMESWWLINLGQDIQEWTKKNLWKTAFKKFKVIWCP